MASDCRGILENVVYNCSNPWGQGCVSSTGFTFLNLWNYTQNIQKTCPSDSRLFGVSSNLATPQNAALTLAACAAVAGYTWRYYPGEDIWNRLTSWKFPLLQLVASFPRPPLSFWVEMFVVNHLLGDPIDTLKNLFIKMSNCQRRAEDWQDQLRHRPIAGGHMVDRDWKTLAIVSDSYAEWGLEDRARETLRKDHLRQLPTRIASVLAADRATKSLPIVVAQCIFISSVGIAIFRTAAAADSSTAADTVFINVEAHSIAFSALYLWVIPAVFLGSIIGVSQTEGAIPRILRMDDDTETEPRLRNLNQELDKNTRFYHGGIYSWQPSLWQSTASTWRQKHMLLPYLIVLLGGVTGLTISALVPPDGIDCRHIGQLSILAIWLLSAELDILLHKIFPLTTTTAVKNNRARLFWWTYAKDLLATCATMGGVIATQVGLFNRCSCYTQWGATGLALPEMPDVAVVLRARLGREYPAITFTAILVELLVVPLAVWVWYGDALRVYVQRDDGESNLLMVGKMVRPVMSLKRAVLRAWGRWWNRLIGGGKGR